MASRVMGSPSKQGSPFRHTITCLLTTEQYKAYKKLLRRESSNFSVDLRQFAVKRITEANLYNVENDPQLKFGYEEDEYPLSPDDEEEP